MLVLNLCKATSPGGITAARFLGGIASAMSTGNESKSLIDNDAAFAPSSSGGSPRKVPTPQPQQHDFTLRKLFGGAMECLLPAAYVDVSDLRQVPDHQEVFASKTDGVSIIIEVLSFESDVNSAGSEGESARHFFDDLATANGATSSTCDFCGDVSDSVMPKLSKYSKSALVGRQMVAKFRGDGPAEAVGVYLVNVRLPNVDTDLLLTMNVPYPDEASAAEAVAAAGTRDTFIFETNTPPMHRRIAGSVEAENPTLRTEESASQRHSCSDSLQEPSSTVERSGNPSDCGARRVEGSAESVSCDGNARDSDDGNSKGEEGIRSGGGAGDSGVAGVAVLKMMLESFDIRDWSLFG